MFTDFLIDITRFTHFIGLALGIGAGSFADFSLMKKLDKEITPCDLNNLETVHRIVWVGLTLLWTSGLALLYVRTGFDPALFSPKLIMKLLVVAILTVNAVLLGSVAMPILKANVDKTYLSFALEEKAQLCLLAALSIASWMSGLILGIFSALRPASFEFIMPIFSTIYASALFGGVIATIVLHIIWERRQKKLYRYVEAESFNIVNLPSRQIEGINSGILHAPASANSNVAAYTKTE